MRWWRGERQQIDVGRDGLHLARREDEHAERVADQTDDNERQRRAVVDPDGHHLGRVLGSSNAASHREVSKTILQDRHQYHTAGDQHPQLDSAPNVTYLARQYWHHD